MPDGEPDDTADFPVHGDPVREPTSGRARTRSIVISILVALLVAAGTVAAILIPDGPRHVTSAVTPTTPSAPPSAAAAAPRAPSSAPSPSASASVTVESLKAGQCYQVGLGDNPVDSLATCSDRHTGEVVGTADLGDKADPKKLNDLATAACGPVFAAYIGSPPEQSSYDLATIAPDEDGYRNGNHTVICLAQTETPTTGSVAGTEKSNQDQSSR